MEETENDLTQVYERLVSEMRSAFLMEETASPWKPMASNLQLCVLRERGQEIGCFSEAGSPGFQHFGSEYTDYKWTFCWEAYRINMSEKELRKRIGDRVHSICCDL